MPTYQSDRDAHPLFCEDCGRGDCICSPFEDCERDTGHHLGCGTFDPDDGECDCGLIGPAPPYLQQILADALAGAERTQPDTHPPANLEQEQARAALGDKA